MGRARWIVVALGVAALIGVVVALGSSGARDGLIDNNRLSSLVADGALLVDVRTPAEFATGHIPDAENIPMSGLEQAAAGWDRSEPIALYCATGSRSAEAATMLRNLGFTTVYDLGGGIVQWDGEIAGGSRVAEAASPSASGLPVMYEFYTDW